MLREFQIRGAKVNKKIKILKKISFILKKHRFFALFLLWIIFNASQTLA